MIYKKFRSKYPEFIYDSFYWELEKSNLRVSFYYKVGNEFNFKTELLIKNIPNFDIVKAKDQVDNLIFNIGMTEIFSYWKAFCSPKIIVNAGFLDNYQIKWWKKLLIKGMGQYFYENKIDFRSKNFVNIESSSRPLKIIPFKVGKSNAVLVPVGGGKDSVVTLETIKNHFDALAYIVNPTKAQIDVVNTASVKYVVVDRKLDKQIFDLNEKGFLNGHIPYTAVTSFISLLVGAIFNKSYVVYSNEKSSDEGNANYLGYDINHQYSKTLEFENDIRDYNRRYLTNIDYFSYLRPIYDLQIVEIFSKFPKYYQVIRSCNVGQRTDLWCGSCAKCLSTYILFYPFLKQHTQKIFGKNLLEDKSLKTLLEELTKDNKIKPFECVGTKHELNIALGFEYNDISDFWGQNNLPAIFKLILYLNLHLKNKKTAILGYGREGKSTEKLLEKYIPNIKCEIKDQGINPIYLNNLDEYDIVFKSPGIPNKLPEIKILKEKGIKLLSQTNVFLNLFRDQTIGITGTKGKSTTTSLIYHILLTNGVKTKLMGNIGIPFFDKIEKVESDEVLVCELSSHQLSNVFVSPHIAILLNIYPEHLDYYENFDDYKRAKSNIFRFQNEKDIFISEKDIDKLSLPIINSKLKGEHNLKNIKAAYLATRSIGLSDKQILAAISTFEPLADRMEVIRNYKGITFINDGLATIPEATLATINAYKNEKLTLILGGFDRGINFDVFGEKLSKISNITNIILIGQVAHKIEKALESSGFIGSIINLGFSNMKEIVNKAFKITSPGGYVILSPSATSFDMFKDYTDRDNQFKEAVNNLR